MHTRMKHIEIEFNFITNLIVKGKFRYKVYQFR